MNSLIHDQSDPLKCAVAYNRYGAYCVPLASAHRPAAKLVLRGEVFEEDTNAYRTMLDDVAKVGPCLQALLTSCAQTALQADHQALCRRPDRLESGHRREPQGPDQGAFYRWYL